MNRNALIVYGGWEGHEPEKVSKFFEAILMGEGFKVERTDDMTRFEAGDISEFDLIVPVITMSTITREQLMPILEAVAEHGVGLAGCHGGMCDAFRNETEWHFMTGGQWVAHPGNDGVRYKVFINRDVPHEITAGLPDLDIVSEQYYLQVDPGNVVLAYTEFPLPGAPGPHSKNPCRMPTVWIKRYGEGRVFYNALGHQANILMPETPRELMRRGFLWAARD